MSNSPLVSSLDLHQLELDEVDSSDSELEAEINRSRDRFESSRESKLQNRESFLTNSSSKPNLNMVCRNCPGSKFHQSNSFCCEDAYVYSLPPWKRNQQQNKNLDITGDIQKATIEMNEALMKKYHELCESNPNNIGLSTANLWKAIEKEKLNNPFQFYQQFEQGKNGMAVGEGDVNYWEQRVGPKISAADLASIESQESTKKSIQTVEKKLVEAVASKKRKDETNATATVGSNAPSVITSSSSVPTLSETATQALSTHLQPHQAKSRGGQNNGTNEVGGSRGGFGNLTVHGRIDNPLEVQAMQQYNPSGDSRHDMIFGNVMGVHYGNYTHSTLWGHSGQQQNNNKLNLNSSHNLSTIYPCGPVYHHQTKRQVLAYSTSSPQPPSSCVLPNQNFTGTYQQFQSQRHHHHQSSSNYAASVASTAAAAAAGAFFANNSGSVDRSRVGYPQGMWADVGRNSNNVTSLIQNAVRVGINAANNQQNQSQFGQMHQQSRRMMNPVPLTLASEPSIEILHQRPLVPTGSVDALLEETKKQMLEQRRSTQRSRPFLSNISEDLEFNSQSRKTPLMARVRTHSPPAYLLSSSRRNAMDYLIPPGRPMRTASLSNIIVRCEDSLGNSETGNSSNQRKN